MTSRVAIGQLKQGLETPRLCVDLDRFDQNLRAMSDAIHGAGKKWRPHAKCHKSPDIARRQIEAGAIGITCAKVSEAEVFAKAGIRDILIAHLPVGPARVERIAALCRVADLIVTCDHYAQLGPLSKACIDASVTCRILVDINIGMNRTGVRPGSDTLELARAIGRFPGLKLVGVMGYEGHAMSIMDEEAKQRAVQDSLGLLARCRDQFQRNGLCCDILSAAGTGSLSYAAQCEGISELQAGGGIFGDPFYTRMPGVTGYQPALTVLTTVVSRPSLDRAVLDAGRKAITGEMHSPLVKDHFDARVVMHSAEHIVLELGSVSKDLKIGDLVELIVGYADFTTPLHDEFYCFRGDRLEGIWPIAARGMLQ
jgi:D-serine deaminase-like pyridoxal phosphate-dependent protein